MNNFFFIRFVPTHLLLSYTVQVDVGTSVVPQLKTGYLEANAIDSVTHNATQCYISGDTAVGILNFIEGFLVRYSFFSMICATYQYI